MRDSLKSSVGWLSFGWLWVFVLLALPACDQLFGLQDVADDKSSAIFCDIELARRCPATADDMELGIPLSQAAVALTTGQQSDIGLDHSKDCGGQPEAVVFQGQFPDGYQFCLNCDIGSGEQYHDVKAACVALCKGRLGLDDAVCENARPSTNTPATDCYHGACTEGGNPLDPLPVLIERDRRDPEPVLWELDPTSLIGVSVFGTPSNNLVRIAPTTGNFDAGAASSPDQVIRKGDGYVEFTATETDKARVCGLSSGATDTSPGLTADMFAIDVFTGGKIFIFEGGSHIANPKNPADGSFGSYAATDRFRVSVQENPDGRATVIYSRLNGPCAPRTICNLEELHRSGPASYPFRVDASFREKDGTLNDVRIVRIR